MELFSTRLIDSNVYTSAQTDWMAINQYVFICMVWQQAYSVSFGGNWHSNLGSMSIGQSTAQVSFNTISYNCITLSIFYLAVS